MKKFMISSFCISALSLVCLICFTGCKSKTDPGAVSMTGVKETVVEVKTGPDGLTNEQRNIKERLKQDNEPGSIKHLYVFSSMTGKCMLYSTVKGKVTSSGKRLSPTTLYRDGASGYPMASFPGTQINTPSGTRYTPEAIQDDGTYGSSVEYLYWFDVKDTYRQLYPPSGCILVLSTEPLSIPENEMGFRFTK